MGFPFVTKQNMPIVFQTPTPKRLRANYMKGAKCIRRRPQNEADEDGTE
ncbi:hypothetical protein Acr_29g0004890 [Actinidia rufa]|uniref:Uncharacterized protein n=1 Tax=Actinidia rufa TaxID=165716 RepID=A0A7J0HDX2_9ERIC|nr:hypothetical protein Acr_29g0004890 [Actinidia rufa]